MATDDATDAQDGVTQTVTLHSNVETARFYALLDQLAAEHTRTALEARDLRAKLSGATAASEAPLLSLVQPQAGLSALQPLADETVGRLEHPLVEKHLSEPTPADNHLLSKLPPGHVESRPLPGILPPPMEMPLVQPGTSVIEKSHVIDPIVPSATQGGLPSAILHKEMLKDALRSSANSFPRSSQMRTMELELSISAGRCSDRSRRLLKSKSFEYLMLTSCFANVVWIAIELDTNRDTILAKSAWYFQFIENLFCLIFFFEWGVHVLGVRPKTLLFRSRWFIFNTVLLVQMVTETWVMYLVSAASRSWMSSAGILRVFRLLRLGRVLRTGRMLTLAPELLFVFQGMKEALRIMAIASFLILLTFFSFGLLLRILSDGTKMGSTYFSNVPMAMFHLFVHATLLDSVSKVMKEVGGESIPCGIAFGFVILLAAFIFTNMMLGLIIDVMTRTADSERDNMRIQAVHKKVKAFLSDHGLDKDGDGQVSKGELQAILENEEAVQVLRDVDVDVEALVDFADIIFQSDAGFEKRLTFEEFMELVLQLRGSAPATLGNIVDLKQFIYDQNNIRNLRLDALEARLQEAKMERSGLQGTLMSVHKQVKNTDTILKSLAPHDIRYRQYLNFTQHKRQARRACVRQIAAYSDYYACLSYHPAG